MSLPPIRDVGFHLFAYGTLRAGTTAAARMLDGCTHVCTASVAGTLYDIDGEYSALILYGETPVPGDVWHVPDSARLQELDEYEGVGNGLFRRIGVEVGELACWAYVAGPALAHRLTPERRILTSTV